MKCRSNCFLILSLSSKYFQEDKNIFFYGKNDTIEGSKQQKIITSTSYIYFSWLMQVKKAFRSWEIHYQTPKSLNIVKISQEIIAFRYICPKTQFYYTYDLNE